MELLQQIVHLIGGWFGLRIDTAAITNDMQQMVDAVSLEATALIASTTASVVGTSTTPDLLPAAHQVWEMW